MRGKWGRSVCLSEGCCLYSPQSSPDSAGPRAGGGEQTFIKTLSPTPSPLSLLSLSPSSPAWSPAVQPLPQSPVRPPQPHQQANSPRVARVRGGSFSGTGIGGSNLISAAGRAMTCRMDRRRFGGRGGDLCFMMNIFPGRGGRMGERQPGRIWVNLSREPGGSSVQSKHGLY